MSTHDPPEHEDAPAPAQPPEPPPRAAAVINPYSQPVQTEAERPRGPGAPRTAGPARRLAGGVLIANGILVLLWVAIAPASGPLGASPSGSDAFQMGSGVGRILPALIDMLIGVSLLRGSVTLVPWAILRCVGGIVLASALHLPKDPVAVVHQAILGGAVIGLLAGEAGRVRMAIAGSAAGLGLILEMVGIAAVATGGNPLGSVIMALSGDIESSPMERVSGRAAPYELSFPNRSWYARKQAVAARDNPLADRWFVRPDRDAHLIVIAEEAPDKLIPVDAYTDAILENLRKDATNVSVHRRETWPVFGERGVLVDAAATRNGMALEWRYALVTVYGRAYYLVGFATREAMPSVEADIRVILDSFKLPEAVQNAVPADVEPAPVTRVRGSSLPYTLEAPDGGWYQRKHTAFKAENPLVDHWLTRPEMDTHVLVVAEQADPGSVVVLSAYVDNVLGEARKGTTRFDVLERGPWARFPNEGVRVRASALRNGIELEYDYAFYARGRDAFQLAGLTTKGRQPAAGQAIARLLDSFQPPP